MIIIVVFAILVLILCGSRFITLFIAYRIFHVFAKLHRCRPPPAQEKSIFHKFRLVSQKYGNLFEDYYAAKFERYGPTHAIYDLLGRPKVIHTIDPINLRAVLVDSFEDWGVFINKRNSLKPLAQEGLLTTDGPLWQRNRKYLSRKVNTRRAKDALAAEQDTRQLFDAISACNGGSPTEVVNMTMLMQNMALDMSSRHLFGVSTDLQLGLIHKHKGNDDEPSNWQKLMQSYVSNWATLRHYISLRSAIGSKYWMIDGLKYRRACSRFGAFADMFITKATEKSRSTKTHGGQFLIDDFIREIQSPRETRQFVMELVIAGQNMTGTSLEWAVAELAEHPDVYARLRTELIDTFGPNGNEPLKQLTWDNLQSCRLLQNVISETLRCHPPVATMSRTASRDTVLPRGGGVDGNGPVAVPKGATLTSNIFLVHRREEVWGEDSSEWNPDRWLSKKIDVGFIPFGAGPRICLGRQMSLIEMSYVLARFVRRFEEIRPAAGADNLSYQYRSILSPKNVVRITLKEAESA